MSFELQQPHDCHKSDTTSNTEIRNTTNVEERVTKFRIRVILGRMTTARGRAGGRRKLQGGSVKYFRIYTDADGETHFEDLEFDLPIERNASKYSELIPATGVIFRYSSKDQDMDWHPAPRRQFVITLSGHAEVEASDGEVRQIGPGTIMLAEDTDGKGHLTRGVGDEDRHSIFIPLPD